MENTGLEPLIIPKGTRIKVQGCPFYLSEDAYVGNGNAEDHAVLQSALAEEQNHMAEIKANKGKNLASSDDGKHTFYR